VDLLYNTMDYYLIAVAGGIFVFSSVVRSYGGNKDLVHRYLKKIPCLLAYFSLFLIKGSQ